MLKTRLITAVALLAVLIPITLWASVSLFGALVGAVLALAAWEWARLLRLSGWAPLVYALVAGLALFLSAARGTPGFSAGLDQAAAVFWVLAVPYALWRKPCLAQGAWRGFLLLAGLLLFMAGWHALVVARAAGAAFVLSLLLVVWLADIGAYFAGKRFGRHKLAPAVSPGKTWEGAAGGWCAVMLATALAWLTAVATPNLVSALKTRFGAAGTLIALTLLVAFSIVGDLFESLLKRQAGVKDSSALLPGHGGVLDRIDALLPVLPLAMLLLS